jgi:hypothetical protein
MPYCRGIYANVWRQKEEGVGEDGLALLLEVEF